MAVMATDEDRAGHALCATCGVETTTAAGFCEICVDERQYLPSDGVQRWITIGEERLAGARIEVGELEPGLYGLDQVDGVGIGQRAKVIRTAHGGVMVDVPAYIDDAAIAAVEAIGGVKHIIATHPHMYGVQSLWAEAFGATVWISGPDAGWVRVPPTNTQTFTEDVEIVPGVNASIPGGHFRGSTVVHFMGGDDAGVLLAGDAMVPTPDGWATFLRSYPNRIPLSAAVVRRVAEHVTSRFAFERLYDNFTGVIRAEADNVITRSADRYARWVSGEYDNLT